jgi:hypothetical protein
MRVVQRAAGVFALLHDTPVFGPTTACRRAQLSSSTDTAAGHTCQAKACGDVLLVGVVGDAEILANKGPPVFTEEERCAPRRRLSGAAHTQLQSLCSQ